MRNKPLEKKKIVGVDIITKEKTMPIKLVEELLTKVANESYLEGKKSILEKVSVDIVKLEKNYESMKPLLIGTGMLIACLIYMITGIIITLLR